MSKGCKIHRNVTWEGRCPVCLQNEIATLTAQVEKLTKALLEISSIDDCMTDETGSLPASYLMRGIAIHALGKDVP